MTPRWLIMSFTVLVVSVLATVVAFRAWQRSGTEVYRTFSSPDNRFQIVVFRTPAGFGMPGQSSDAPGYFQLRNTRSGQVLKEDSVEMVQLVDRVEWTPTNVNVKLLADWSLPQ